MDSKKLGTKLIKKAFKQLECYGIEGELKEEKDGTYTFFAYDKSGQLLKFNLEMKSITEVSEDAHPEIFDYSGKDDDECEGAVDE